MAELEVRIVRLGPLRVASVHAFGKSPEPEAYRKLLAWAEPWGLFDAAKPPRIFGFNNPSPSQGDPEYGYELWITVGPDVTCDEGDAEIKAFPGGFYAVTRVKGIGLITPTWHRLAMWCEESGHERASHQWLEEHIGPAVPTQSEGEIVLDLFHPISA